MKSVSKFLFFVQKLTLTEEMLNRLLPTIHMDIRFFFEFFIELLISSSTSVSTYLIYFKLHLLLALPSSLMKVGYYNHCRIIPIFSSSQNVCVFNTAQSRIILSQDIRLLPGLVYSQFNPKYVSQKFYFISFNRDYCSRSLPILYNAAFSTVSIFLVKFILEASTP